MQAIKINPQYMKTYHELARTLESVGRIKEAIDCWRDAIEANPNT